MIFRVEKTKNYTVMSNHHLRDKNLSLKAKGLLSWFLSNTDDWDYSIQGIVANCKENETAITSALDELKRFGYLSITKLTPDKTNSGRFEYIYNIYERPKQDIEKQDIENLCLEFLSVENQVQRNTEIKNTKKEILKKSLIDKSIKDIGKTENSLESLFIQKYNKLCTNLPKCLKLTDKRIKAIKNLLKQYDWMEIEDVFRKANESAFLTGKNDRGWKADIDFLLREDKFVSIMENKYGGKAKNSASTEGHLKLDRNIDKQKFREDIASGKAEKF